MSSGGGRHNSEHVLKDARETRSGVDLLSGGGENGGGGEGDGEELSTMRKADEYMPIANITRIMRRVLPLHAKVADDTKETIQECVTEFISYVTTEANARCHAECRKTITAEDIISAMGGLGFASYVTPLSMYLRNYRAQDPNRRPLPLPRPQGRRGSGGEGSSSSALDMRRFGQP